MLNWLVSVLTVFVLMTVTVTGLPRQLGNQKTVATEDTFNSYQPTSTWSPPRPHRRINYATNRPTIQSSHDRVATVSRILTGNRANLGEIHRRIETEAEDVECQEQPQRRSPTQDGYSSLQSTRSPCNRANQTSSTLASAATATVTQQPRADNTMRAVGDIVFPDGDLFPSFVPRKMAKCKGRTFCEDAEGDYPREHIKKILEQQADKYKSLFGVDVVNETGGNITHRIDLSDELPLCTSRESVVYPKQAQNKEEKWLFIVNQDKYLQGVRVEICIKSNAACQFGEDLPIGYRSKCKQKYIYRNLLALDEAGEPASDSFRFPSCCVCYVKMDHVSRMAGLFINDTSPVKNTTTSPQRKN